MAFFHNLTIGDCIMLALICMMGLTLLTTIPFLLFCQESRRGTRTQMLRCIIIVVSAFVPVYNVLMTGANAKKIAASLNLILAFVSVLAAIWDGIRNYMTWDIKVELTRNREGFDWVLPRGEIPIWGALSNKEKGRLIFSIIFVGVSVYEVVFRFDLVQNKTFILSKWFANSTFSFAPIFVGLESLYVTYKDWSGSSFKFRCLLEGLSTQLEGVAVNAIFNACLAVPNGNAAAPPACGCTYRSLTCTLRTSSEVDFSVNFLERTGGHADDWSVENMDLTIISFAVHDLAAINSINGKITSLRALIPSKPILLIDTDIPEGKNDYQLEAIRIAGESRADLLMLCSFDRDGLGQRVIDAIAIFCHCY